MPWKQASEKFTGPRAKASAPKLRRAMTDAERQLWQQLRGDIASASTHFRRQVAIGPYVVDFCCYAKRVVVEVDGPVHARPSQQDSDRERDIYLRGQGYRIVRVTNQEVSLHMPSVLRRIATVLDASTPTPSPSPQGGGGHP